MKTQSILGKQTRWGKKGGAEGAGGLSWEWEREREREGRAKVVRQAACHRHSHLVISYLYPMFQGILKKRN